MTRLAYSPEEVGQMVGRNRKTVIEWCRTGLLKGKQVNGRWLIAAEDVRRFVQADAKMEG